MATSDGFDIQGHVSRGFEAVREAFAENFARRGELGGACCAYSPRREGRRPVGRHPEQADRRAVGAGHHGDRLLGHQGPGRDDPRHRPLSRLARLRRAGVRVLAGVRAARQGANHRPPAPGTPGRPVRLRRAGRSERGRRPRSPGGRAGASEAGVGAGNAAGVSRDHPRVLRGRAVAPRRSTASQPGTVLPGRDRHAARAGRLHPAAGGDPELAPGHPRAAQPARDAARLPDFASRWRR